MTPNAPPDRDENFQNVARRLARDEGWLLADQLENRVNVRVHEETTDVEILEQTGGAGRSRGSAPSTSSTG